MISTEGIDHVVEFCQYSVEQDLYRKLFVDLCAKHNLQRKKLRTSGRAKWLLCALSTANGVPVTKMQVDANRDKLKVAQEGSASFHADIIEMLQAPFAYAWVNGSLYQTPQMLTVLSYVMPPKQYAPRIVSGEFGRILNELADKTLVEPRLSKAFALAKENQPRDFSVFTEVHPSWLRNIVGTPGLSLLLRSYESCTPKDSDLHSTHAGESQD